MKYTKELLGPLVVASTSIMEVLRRLGLRHSGGSHAYLSQAIKKLGLDTTHFKGIRAESGNNRAMVRPKLTWEQVLILRPATANRSKAHILRRALQEYGRPYVCESCGQLPWWNEKPLVLQVEHKNSLTYDDRPENLEFLCPNCHTQTPSYARVKTSGRRCSGCHKRLFRKNKSGKCWDCQHPAK
jgi:hypothetical protein